MKGATLPHRVWVSPLESMGSPPGGPPVRQADGGLAGITGADTPDRPRTSASPHYSLTEILFRWLQSRLLREP